jgi:hypothetical protein
MNDVRAKGLIVILCIVLCLTFNPNKARATVVDINGAYSSFTVAPPTGSDSSVATIYDVGIGIDYKKNWLFMLSYSGASSSVVMGTTTNTYSTADMGVRFGRISQSKNWIITATYNFTSTGSYKPGTSPTRELRGTSYKADLGYNVWFGDLAAVSIRLAYYGASYTEYVISGTLTQTSHTFTGMYPSLGLFYLF